MRVSPALLACFSLVAISGLPSQAAESSELVDNASTLEANPQLASDPAEVPASVHSPAELAVSPVITVPTADTTFSPAPEPVAAPVATGPSLDQLLGGVTRKSAPPMLSQTDDAAAMDAADTVPPESVIAAEPDAVSQIILPTPAGSDDAVPRIPAPTLGEPTGLEDEAIEDGAIEADESAPVEAVPNQSIPTEAAPTQTPASSTDDAAESEEARVLVAEVNVVSSNADRPLTSELIDAVYNAVETSPGRTSTRTQLQEDISSIFSTGFFSSVSADPQDTPLGVKVVFSVEPNPVLSRVNVQGRQVLEDETIDEIFGSQYGEILNLRDFQDSIFDLNTWYQDNGYVLANVTPLPQISPNGTATLLVAEGEIESIEVRYITPDGEITDDDGNLVDGKTRDFIVLREFETEPGDIFQESAIQQDVGRAFNLSIFEDIRLSLEEGEEDATKVKLIVNVAERDTGSVGASLGFNLRGDLFGQLSYNEDNFGGNNQKLRTEGRVTTRGDFLFDLSFTDPWIAGDPYRTSYTASLFNRRATSLIFDNGEIEVDLEDGDDVLGNGDTPRLNRLGTGLSFSRPLDNGLSLSLGGQYERVAILDADGDVTPRDELGNLLTASDNGRDDLLTVQFGAVLDRRNNPAVPTSGSLFRLGTEQSVPVGNGSIFFNKIRGSYSQYVPVSFFGNSGRETIAFNVQGGTAIGEIPPYEAFPLGGGNSVRGFEEGAVGSGRSFALGTVEYRFPLFSEFLNGALFADYGTDFGSGSSVAGDPAGVRGKPGNGFGYGAGVRVQTPLGALRLDYGLADDGGSRFHFGFGERF